MRQVFVLALTVALSFMMVGIAVPAAAGPGDAPPETGVVTRFSEPGFIGFSDEVVLEGTRKVVEAVFNMATRDDLCAFAFAGAGDIALVTTPSGHENVLLHDDVPVLLFDVTGVEDVPAAVCATDDPLEPFATGTARIRNIIHFDNEAGTFLHRFSAAGIVHDGDSVWSLSAHLRAGGEIPVAGPPPTETHIVLSKRGR